MTLLSHRIVFTLAAAGLVAALDSATAYAQLTADRDIEPVVLTGLDVPNWSGPPQTVQCQPYPSGALTGARDAHNGIDVAPPATGVDVNQIAAYRWDGGQFVEIPVQVDEMYYYCLSNPNSDFGVYSGTDKELTYSWDDRGLTGRRLGIESWKKISGSCTAEYFPGESPKPDPVPTLDNDDEIVFMASDSGSLAPIGAPLPAGVTDVQAVIITDPLDPLTLRYVYLMLQPGGSSFDITNGYVSYVRDANADEWVDRFSFAAADPEKLGSSNTGYGPNLSGDVCDPPSFTPRASTDRFPRDGITVTSDVYRYRATGRWMTREVQVAKPGQPGVYGPDLIDRWKGRAFQQSPDSTISLVGFEDEQVNWEANAATLGELAGPVRAMREVWGADSGTNVTKIEHYYRHGVGTRYHVRVHPIPPDGLYSSWDYNRGVAVKYYNVNKPGGVDIDGVNDDLGNIDGVSTFPAFFDVVDPTFSPPSALLQWEQVSGASDFGSLVYIIELKGPTTFTNAAVVPYYRDDACLDDGTGDDPVRRPWPGEATTDSRVRDGYCVAANGGPPGRACGLGEYELLTCTQKQGAHAAHGVHYFFTQDSDNLASPETLTEIDSMWWQFMVPTSAPTNVGAHTSNIIVAPLQVATVNLGAQGGVAPPIAADGSAFTDQGVDVEITLTATDIDTCEMSSFTIVDAPTGGTLSVLSDQACSPGTPNTDSAKVTYMPNASFSGQDTFTFKVNDGTSDSNTATVTINVQPDPTLTPTPTVTPTSTSGGGATATVTMTGTPTPQPSPPPDCNQSTMCASQPASGCRQPVVPGKAMLQLKNRTPDQGDRITWKWVKGAATAKAEFGTPLSTTDYEMCVYDSTSNLIARACAPADGICAGKPCWKETRRGFKYRKRDVTGSGLKNSLQVILKSGGAGAARISVKGKGGNPPLPAMPLSQPVTVQLVNGGGVCWEATYSAPALRNDGIQFKDKAD